MSETFAKLDKMCRFLKFVPTIFTLLLLVLTSRYAFAESFPLAATATSDGAISIWNDQGKSVRTMGDRGSAISTILLLPSASGNTIISAGASGEIVFWQRSTGKAERRIKTTSGNITALAISTDSRWVATGGADRHIRLWDVQSGKLLGDVQAHGDTVRSLLFFDGNAQLVSASEDKMIRTWKLKGDQSSVTIQYRSNIPAHDDGVNCLALSTDKMTLASVSGDGFCKTWKLDNNGLVNRMKVGNRNILSTVFNPDGNLLATGDEDGRIRLWHTSGGMSSPVVINAGSPVSALLWGSNCSTIVNGCADGSLQYWDATSGKQLLKVPSQDGAIRCIISLP